MLQRIKWCKFRSIHLSAVALFGLMGCVGQHSSFISTKALAIAEVSPQLNFDQEVMSVRLSQVLLKAKLTNRERADLLFERGVIYDSLGLWSLARYDFMKALEIRPKMAATYNYIGLYLLLEEDYESALDAFNTVLALDPDYDYTYLNRGLSFYYTGRYSEAERDFLHFYQKDKQDPYRILWLYFNELEYNGQLAIANLRERAKQLTNDYWGVNLVRYFLGELSSKALRKKIDAEYQANSTQYAEILTETYFYLAKQKLKMNQVEEAKSLFRLALANQVYNFVEYRFAQFELLRLRANQIEPVVVGKN